MPYDDLIEKHASRVGIDPAWMRKIMRIESGGNPQNVTGSYKGLFQLSTREFNRHGGSGNILDPEQNTMAAANKLAKEKLAFKEKYGRDPKLADLYLIHQQGEGGYAAHMANPDQPAWKSMLSTGEGKAKGENWAKAAIWGNIPDAEKKKFGSAENVTAKDLGSLWGSKVEGTKFEGYGPLMAASKAAKEKGEAAAGMEGAGGTKRGTFLGEAAEPGKFDTPYEGQPQAGMPDFQVPSVASSGLGPAFRGPQVPGATRWEVG